MLAIGVAFFIIYLFATITDWYEPSTVYLLLGIIFAGIGVLRIITKKDGRLLFKRIF